MALTAPCPHCHTSSTAFANWQEAEAVYQRIMEDCLKPRGEVRDARRDATLALERRRACREKHEDAR